MTTEISDLDNSENKKDLIKRLSEAKSSVILPSSGNKLVTRNSELTAILIVIQTDKVFSRRDQRLSSWRQQCSHLAHLDNRHRHQGETVNFQVMG